ncbi:9995_t:CDS:2 [Paraglomus occultum]|uniref:9995_t:CDS:1 n=1 Tax=Paraglomus occultum TaxID=144539 RepID=A0A9N8ZMB5_9GLOM|nr:9995_t:CDS:2 [Paraglomus occultum]
METLGTFSNSPRSSINNAKLLQISSLVASGKSSVALLTPRRNTGFLVKRFSTISNRRVEIYEEEDEFAGGCCGLFRNLKFIRGEHESDAKTEDIK